MDTLDHPLNLAAGLTDDGRRLFRGDRLFELKATHGLPLDFALDRIVNELGMAVAWTGFIEAARRNGWWDFQTYEAICHGMEDAGLPRDMQREIAQRFKRYVLDNPHPKMRLISSGNTAAYPGETEPVRAFPIGRGKANRKHWRGLPAD